MVLGFGGGEIDHIIGNAQIITKYSDKNELFFLDTYRAKKGFGTKLGVVLNAEFRINLSIGSTITIIPFEESIITTKGLKWDLKNKTIDSNFFSLRNYNTSSEVIFKLSKGRALIILDITQDISSLKKQLNRILCI